MFLAEAFSAIVAFGHGLLGLDFTPVTIVLQGASMTGRSSGSVDSFIGIPHAEPPTGSARLKPPQPKQTPYQSTMLPAKATAPAQTIKFVSWPHLFWIPLWILFSILPVTRQPHLQSEDCLSITIQRPTGTKDDAKLPVLFFIYGGAFRQGSTQVYDAQRIIKESVELGMPLIFVTANYRVGAHGFLGGKEVQAERCGNLGLKDQRLALEWTADNIAAFGGDPAKVTIWGESAGAFSVFDHLIISNGNHHYHSKPLFRAAVMSSGSVSRLDPITCNKAQANYDSIIASHNLVSHRDTLSRLRDLPFSAWNASVPVQSPALSYDSLNGPYYPRHDPLDPFFNIAPEQALRNNVFARVPILLGCQEDEGPVFATQQRNLKTTRDLVNYLEAYFPGTSREAVLALVDMYPNNPVDGSPYHTGERYNSYPQQKRLASILGDYFFTAMKRIALKGFAGKVPVWSYTSTYLRDTSAIGTFHASDITELFYGKPLRGPAASHPLMYLIAFVHGMDPNIPARLPHWPQWDEERKMGLEFTAKGAQVVAENTREAIFEFYMEREGQFFL